MKYVVYGERAGMRRLLLSLALIWCRSLFWGVAALLNPCLWWRGLRWWLGAQVPTHSPGEVPKASQSHPCGEVRAQSTRRSTGICLSPEWSVLG